MSSDADVQWTRDLSGNFYGAGADVGPGWLTLRVNERGTVGLVGFNNDGDVQWRLSPTGAALADGELLWISGRRLRIVRASTGLVCAQRDFFTLADVVVPGVAMIGTLAEGKLMGLDSALSTLWEWAESAFDWNGTHNYLWRLREGHAHLVSLPRLERKEIPLSTRGRGVHTGFEYENVIALVAIADGESSGVSWDQGKEVWRRVVEPRGLARKWGDSFLFYGERLQRVKISSGETIWEFPLESQVAQARVVGDEIFLATASGRIQVVDCRTGDMNFDALLPAEHKGQATESPHVVLPCGREHLFVVTNTRLYCVARSPLG